MSAVLRGLGKALAVLLVLAAAALPAVYTNSVYGYLPVLGLLAALLLSAICLPVLGRRLSVEADAENVECARGGSIEVGLRVKNRSLLACPKADAWLYISDLFGRNDSVRKTRFTVGGRTSVSFSFDMDMSHVGLYDLGLEAVDVYGFFGFLRKRVPAAGRLTALVTPRLRPVETLDFSGEQTMEANRDTRVTVVGGTDYTGVREYALGDPMKQIHWKLSAHSREYVTKLQESSRQQEYAVVLDFAAEPSGDREGLLALCDCLIETALSLVDEISRHDAGYALLYAARGGGIERAVPTGPESFPELLRSFAYISPAGGEFPDACQILRQESRTGRSTNVLAVTSRVTEELLQELQRVKRQRRSPELYCVVPAAWTSRDIENAAARLRTLDELEIPHFFIPTSENYRP